MGWNSISALALPCALLNTLAAFLKVSQALRVLARGSIPDSDWLFCLLIHSFIHSQFGF